MKISHCIFFVIQHEKYENEVDNIKKKLNINQEKNVLHIILSQESI